AAAGGRVPAGLGDQPDRVVSQLACRAAFSAMPSPVRASTSTVPVTELRRNSMPFWPERVLAATTRPSAVVTFVPAVTYRPASTTQSSPREIPMPAFAPNRQRSPIDTTSLPPPDRVPMIDDPSPMSEPSPT